MRFSLPFPGETSESLQASNRSCWGGSFLLGRSRFWHGGIHLESTKPTLVIADGAIVAYRIVKELKQYKDAPAAYPYSSSFVLVEHEYESPKGNKLKFYSLYMHLLPTSEYKKATPEKPYPVFFKKRTAKVATDAAAPAIAGITMRNPNGDKVGILPKGARVHVGPALTVKEKEKLKPWMRESKADYRVVADAIEFHTEDATLHGDYLVTAATGSLKSLGGDRGYEVIGDSDKPTYPEMNYLKGLAIRSSRSASDNRNVVGVLRKGTEIQYTEIDGDWAQLLSPVPPGTAKPFFLHRNALSDEKVVEITTFDEIVVDRIPVKAGDVIGYPGVYALPRCSSKPVIHHEVFADESLVTFMGNPAKEGVADQKIVIALESGKELKKREDLNQGLANAAEPIQRWTQCRVTASGPVAKHSKVELLGMVGIVERDWLGAYVPATKSYPVKAGAPKGEATTYKDKITTAFGGAEINWATVAFKLLDEQVDASGVHAVNVTGYRKVSFEFAAKKTVFARRTDLPATDKDGLCLLEARIAETFKMSPDQYKFTETLHRFQWTEYRDLMERRDAEVALDADDAPWLRIEARTDAGAGVVGWIKLADIKEESVFDWPRFQIVKETSPDADGFFDLMNLSPFFQDVTRAIDTNKDGQFSEEELVSAQSNRDVVRQLSQMVCLHPSEWQVDAGYTKWEAIKTMANWEETKKLISELVWWDGVKAKLNGFPGPSVYHVHPLAFIEQMEKYVAGTRLTGTDKIRIVKVVGELESGATPYTAVNLDYEFEGRFDQPARWYTDATKAEPDDLSTDVPYSKYSDHPRHVGLSFGLIQFTQEGPLGNLVRSMRAADPAKFETVFGESFQALINTLTATGAAVAADEEVFNNTGTSMGKKSVLRRPSVQPVAGHEVWHSYWVTKFVASGQEVVFQECQQALAVEAYLDVFLDELKGQQLSEKTLTLIYDRSVNQGAGFGQGLAKAIREAGLKTAAEEKVWWNAYIAGRGPLIKPRMQHIRDSAAVSWDRRYAL